MHKEIDLGNIDFPLKFPKLLYVYRVYHLDLIEKEDLWGQLGYDESICIFLSMGLLSFINQFSKKNLSRLALTASDRKGTKYQWKIGFLVIHSQNRTIIGHLGARNVQTIRKFFEEIELQRLLRSMRLQRFLRPKNHYWVL